MKGGISFIMKAVILAGGEGKRLRPITCTMPKPMVPLLNKPTLFYTLELIKKHGLRDVSITLGYMSKCIKNAVGNGEKWGLDVKLSDPEKRLGTAGSVKYAVGECDETVVVLSGDGITDVDLTGAIMAHEAANACATIVLYSVAEPTEYGIAVTDGDGFIKRFIEKPAESEVFSDRANTGIYILSKEAVAAILDGEEYDFSKDLFPKLLGEGKKLLGYNMEGYWCDVGDTGALRRAQADMLEGRLEFSASAERKNGIYIENGAIISEEAVINGPCYIGSGAEIGARVRVDPYTVICSGAKLMEGASLAGSVIMENAVIRRFSELRGTIVCENADIDTRALLLEGSVIGAGTRIGRQATVAQSVSVWPDKLIPPGAVCERDVVWGENAKLNADGPCFTGYADRELTPENCLRVASAFAKGIKPPAELGVGADGSAASVMIKQAVAAGVLSQGVDVVSADAVSRSAFGYLVRNSGLAGGIYVECDEFERRASLRVYGAEGVEADDPLIRNILKDIASGEVRPTTAAEIGLIRSTGGAGMEYEAFVARGTDMAALKVNPRKLILNAAPPIANTVARILLKAGWTVDTVSERRRLISTHNADAISVLIDKNEEISCFMTGVGAVLRDRLLSAAALSLKCAKAVLPTEVGDEIAEYLKQRGTEVIPAPDDSARRRTAAVKANAYEPALLEPEAVTVKLCELFAKGELKKLLSELPDSLRSETEVPVSKCDFGRMLRSMIETEYDRVADMVDGVKLRYDTGWVTVRPSAARSSFRVAAGSRDAEYSRELCDIYSQKLRKLNNREHST